MSPLITAAKIGIYAVMVLTLTAAVGVVTFRSIFHSALALVVTLLGIAAIYLGLGADFIAVVQVLLYVGAVMTLVLFAIMLTHRLGDKSIPQTNSQSLPALGALFLFIFFMVSYFLKANWTQITVPVSERVDVLALATALLGPYVFPFEVVSVILIAALVGAIVIARKD